MSNRLVHTMWFLLAAVMFAGQFALPWAPDAFGYWWKIPVTVGCLVLVFWRHPWDDALRPEGHRLSAPLRMAGFGLCGGVLLLGSYLHWPDLLQVACVIGFASASMILITLVERCHREDGSS
jgi:hypothetical protein